jgi:uncharacterized protein
MQQAQIFIDKGEWLGSQLLYKFILEFLVKSEVNGATVFEGIAGFGKNHYIKDPRSLFSFDDPPLMITFIDNAEKVHQVLTELRKEMSGGFILTCEVTIY